MAFGPDSVMPLGHVHGRVLVVVIIHRLTPVPDLPTLKMFFQGVTLHVLWNDCAGELEKSGREVEVGNQLFIHRSGLDAAGKAGHERHPQGFLVHEPLIEPTVFTQVEALV